MEHIDYQYAMGMTDEEAGRSWSVVAEGTLRRLPDPEQAAFDEATINGAFDDRRVFDGVTVAVYELVPEGLAGRRTAD